MKNSNTDTTFYLARCPRCSAIIGKPYPIKDRQFTCSCGEPMLQLAPHYVKEKTS